MTKHVNYPHEPGYLYDCPACESRCHCATGNAECVWAGHDEPMTGLTLELCSDCVYMAANGWDVNQTGRWLPVPAPLSLIGADALVGSSEDGDPHFSWSPCEGCGCTLGGDRYTVPVVLTGRK